MRPWDPVPDKPKGTLEREESWAAAKQIDGISGEWTYPLWVSRAIRFHFAGRSHYERLPGYDSVLDMVGIGYVVAQADLQPPIIRTVLAVYEGCLDAVDGVLQLPETGERFLGHHEVQLMGVDRGGEELLFQNTWGTNWGDEGIGRFSRSYYQMHAKESWVRIIGDQGLNVPQGLEFFDPALKPQELLEGWTREPPERRVALKEGWFIEWFVVESLRTVARTFVGQLRDRNHVKLGWCNLEVGPTDGQMTALVTDLYVWPHYRRRGVARALYDWATSTAEDAGAELLQVTVHEADFESSHEVPRRTIAERFELQWFEAHPEDALHGVRGLAARYLPRRHDTSATSEGPTDR